MKTYRKPSLTVYGGVEKITQYSFDSGSGDFLFDQKCPLGGCDDGTGS
jgi:hypothetical protein